MGGIFILRFKNCPFFKGKKFQSTPIQGDIILEIPKEGEILQNPQKIRGLAKGEWFFEGQFSVELYDANWNFLGRATLSAKENWANEDFVPFEGELSFSQSKTSFGFLKFLSANPSGIAEYQKIFEMKVKFSEKKFKKIFLYYYNPEKDKDESGNIKCSRDGLVALEREILVNKNPIQEVVNFLLRGKENLTEEEKKQGITTEFPLEGFQLKSVKEKEDKTLILEFEDPFKKTIGGSCRVNILKLQIEETVKQFPEVKKVEFLPEDLFQP